MLCLRAQVRELEALDVLVLLTFTSVGDVACRHVRVDVTALVVGGLV